MSATQPEGLNMQLTEQDVIETCEVHGFPLDPDQLEVVTAVINQILLSATPSVEPVAWFIADDNGEVYRATGYEHERDQWRAVGHEVHPLYTAPQPSPTAVVLDDERNEREAFEHWMTHDYGYDAIDMQTHQDGVYILSAVHEAWEGWQRARAAFPQPVAQPVEQTELHICGECDRQFKTGESAQPVEQTRALTFEWPSLPAFPKPFLDSAKSGAIFTEHQMQAYANAYGEEIRAAICPTVAGFTEREQFIWNLGHSAAQDDARDAARYRWLRKEHFPTADNPPLAQVVWKFLQDRHCGRWVNIIDGDDLDFAIDEALTAARPASGETE